MAAEIIPLRPPGVEGLDELFERLADELCRLRDVERAAAGFVEHVRTRRVAGWHNVPMRPTVHGETGFEQLVAALEENR